jgi:enolase
MAEHTPDPEKVKESTDALSQSQEQLERNKQAVLELDAAISDLVEDPRKFNQTTKRTKRRSS